MSHQPLTPQQHSGLIRRIDNLTAAWVAWNLTGRTGRGEAMHQRSNALEQLLRKLGVPYRNWYETRESVRQETLTSQDFWKKAWDAHIAELQALKERLKGEPP